MDYSYAIIDTDAASNLQLQLQLQEYGDFYHTGTAREAEEGLNLVLKTLPDLVIVNLSQNASLVFQMVMQLHQYVEKLPLLIAVSTSRDYAYDAIKGGFFDYWILPHSEFEIRKTIFKLRKHLPKEQLPSTLCLKTYNDYHYLDTGEILYLRADNNSTDFIMRDGQIISAYKTLKTFENSLPKNFMRVHQSYILNTKYVSRINYGKNTCSLRSSKDQLPFSKSYRDKIDELKSLLSKNAIKTLN
ncbi:MAG: LytTR family transcriptional regulator DNA-binding domain-containing protein [Bacteroidota bacterium]